MLDDVHGVLSDDLDSLPHFQIIRKDLTDEFKKLRWIKVFRTLKFERK
jgi:hypothetical protein